MKWITLVALLSSVALVNVLMFVSSRGDQGPARNSLRHGALRHHHRMIDGNDHKQQALEVLTLAPVPTVVTPAPVAITPAPLLADTQAPVTPAPVGTTLDPKFPRSKAAWEFYDPLGELQLTNAPTSAPGRESIFISLASFSDTECAPTVKDIFQKAKIPENIYLGVIDQRETDAQACYLPEQCTAKGFCAPTPNNIRQIVMHASKARGPTWARYLSATYLYAGEKYFMMIDSHNRFVTHWDQIMLRVYSQAPSKKAVLSHYPEGWDPTKHNEPLDNRATTTYLCKARFTGWGYPRFDGIVLQRPPVPLPTPFCAAGFLFARAEVIKEVPFDPYMQYVFDGEEILYSVRLYTHGWDVFSPNENTFYHYYYRPGHPRNWGIFNRRQRDTFSGQRVQWMLKSTEQGSSKLLIDPNTTDERIMGESQRYGLGTERDLNQYYQFAGLDIVKRVDTKDWCSHESRDKYLKSIGLKS